MENKVNCPHCNGSGKVAENYMMASMPDATGVPLHIDDWVAIIKGKSGDISFGKVLYFNDRTMVIRDRKDKEFRRTSKQVLKVSEEQLTLHWFTL
jgi:hypothetical protein